MKRKIITMVELLKLMNKKLHEEKDYQAWERKYINAENSINFTELFNADGTLLDASVNIQGKAKAAKWQLGTSALILNRYGRGLSYYFTAKNLGTKIRTAYKGCGLEYHFHL